MAYFADLPTSTVESAPSPADSGGSLAVQTGEGSDYSSTPFYAVAHPDNTFPTLDNAEIVLVTDVSGDSLTITRAQLGTTAKNIAVNWRISASIPALIPNAVMDGWIPAYGETWTYNSNSTYTNSNTVYTGDFTVSGDLTTKYYPGMRIKFNQTTDGTKYAIITKVSYSDPNTTIEILLGTDYDLDNETISNPHYSMVKVPAGFNPDPNKWTLETSSTTARSTTSDSLESLTDALTTPLGSWLIKFKVYIFHDAAGSNLSQWGEATLSTNASTETNTDLTLRTEIYAATGIANKGGGGIYTAEEMVTLSGQTTYTMMGRSRTSGITTTIKASSVPTLIQAVCNYL